MMTGSRNFFRKLTLKELKRVVKVRGSMWPKPTFDDIGRPFGLSGVTVSKQVKEARAKGLL